jgi:hypothetical protein
MMGFELSAIPNGFQSNLLDSPFGKMSWSHCAFN